MTGSPAFIRSLGGGYPGLPSARFLNQNRARLPARSRRGRSCHSFANQYFYFHSAILTPAVCSAIVSHRPCHAVTKRRDHTAQRDLMVLLKVTHHRVGSHLAQLTIESHAPG